jgi:hypothetical protein
MRNSRGALGALLLAGAAYAWKNRARLSQQFNSLRQQRTPSGSASTRQYELPDLSPTEQRDFNSSQPANGVYKEREFGGTSF